MDKFSIYNYTRLSDSQKTEFNKAMAWELLSVLDEIKSNEDLDSSLIDEFVASSGQCSDSASVVEDLYSKITSGIQVGSGNQNLFLDILAKYTDCWEKSNRRL